MRPTLLQFRSPKEQTGEFLRPDVTSDGKNLQFKPKSIHSSFPKGQRWEHIREIACRTTFKVGPGCYNTPMTTNKGRSPKIVKPSATLSNGWDYIYVGDSIIKKERPTSRGRSSTLRSSDRANTEASPVSKSYFFEKPITMPKTNQGFYNAGERTAQTYYNRPSSVGRRRIVTTSDFSAIQNCSYQEGGNRILGDHNMRNRGGSQERQRPQKTRENVFYENDNEEWTINQKMVFRNTKKRMQSADFGGNQEY